MSGTPSENPPTPVRRLTREPLLGFALAAAAIFGLHALVADPEVETIALSQGAVDLMIENRTAVLGRGLSDQERDRVIREVADQEVLVREAVRLGLYLHDTKTRKRLVDQMHFLMASKAPKPTPEDLDRLRAEAPERYLFPRTVSFEHVFFAGGEAAATALLRRIEAGAEVPAGAGDRFWLGADMDDYTDAQLTTVLGDDFVRAIRALEPGAWSGPVRSARGWHLVRIESFNDPRPLPDEEVQRRLLGDWAIAHRARTYEAQLAEMRQSYRVEITDREMPSDPGQAALRLVLHDESH